MPAGDRCETGPMIIVQGVFEVEAGQREQYLAETLETQRISRSEDGCIEYVFAADPVKPGRVILSERWETRAHLDAHLAALTARRKEEAESDGRPDEVKPFNREIKAFEATEVDLF